MRLTWHHEADLVVMSLWRDGTCAGTFRLSKDDVNEFIDALVDGVRDAPGVHVSSSNGAHRATSMPARPPAQAKPSMHPEFISPEQQRSEDVPSFTEWAFGSDERATAS
jgi:hypothetical protein